MTITVAVCTRNRPTQLATSLEAVQKLFPAPDEVLVVDNTTGDAETERIARLFGARYVIEPTPGLNHAMKRALAERQTDVIAFLRDDVIPAEHWIASLLPCNPESGLENGTDGKVFSIRADVQR